MQFNRLNNILGWVVFLFAATVYTMTLEPTASFWDCGEFIATAYKLQVGHPPGAPLFLMLSRVFMTLGGNNLESLPVYVNFLSGISSAFAIMFLFWSITHLAKKIISPKGNESTNNLLVIFGSGLIGSIAFCFSDSFWFSAVEGEVYAMSMFFTAITFWAMLRWENVAFEKHGDRWIVFIAYLIGLSIGVHLLSLLAIPALALIYYFKKYKASNSGVVITFLIGCALTGFIFMGLIPGVISLAAKFDLLFVNSLGFGFGSGVIFYALLIVIGIIWGLYYTQKKNKPVWNTAILCFTFIMIGYLSFAQILIRSLANPPMDENNPENAYTFLSYLNREQYGDRPLLYGQYYDAKVIDYKEGAMSYMKGKDKYIETGAKVIPVYDPAHCTFFPRMHSNQANHIPKYKEWANIKGDDKPTFSQNLKFFFAYQFGHMYLRYFMWNFAGKQNDIQGIGAINEGNWITGIKAIDSIFLGPQTNLPQSMTNNKGHNKFYGLPFLLGVIGLMWHFKHNRKAALVVLLFFLFTGIINMMYLNQPPVEPRERDYTLVGSFYAYAIWIGLGIAGTAQFFRRRMKEKTSAILASAVWIVVPVLMAKDGWDDHSRAKRKTSHDFAYDYLNSCAPNAIIFTNGDNDTFPLWYIQDVEGVRTDVRIVNLSLLNTDWYIDQMKRKAYDSDPVPFSLTQAQYEGSNRDYVPFIDKKLEGYQNLADVMRFIASDDPVAKVRTQGGNEINYCPAKKFYIPVDSGLVIRNGTVQKENAAQIEKRVEWQLDKSYMLKNELMIMDLLATNNWKRPIYFAITVGSESYMNLEDYFQLEGLAYRLVPIKSNTQDEMGQRGRVASSVMYDNMMNKFKWGNMMDPDVYMDENNLRMTMNFRNNFSRLSQTLLQEGKKDKAVAVLDKCMEVMPDSNVPFNIFMIRIIDMYYKCASYSENKNGSGNDIAQLPTLANQAPAKNTSTAPPVDTENFEKGNKIAKRLMDIYEDDLNYYLSLKGKYAKGMERDIQQGLAVMGELRRMAKENGQDQLYKELDERVVKMQQKVGN